MKLIETWVRNPPSNRVTKANNFGNEPKQQIMKHLSKAKFLVLGLAGLIALTLVGCNSPRAYSQAGGASGGNAGLIKVTCDSENDRLIPGKNRTVTIVKLDGKKFTSIASNLLLGGPLQRAQGYDVAYVTPGRHEMQLYWKQEVFFANSAVWFVAEAGKTYIIRSKKNITQPVSLWHGESATINFWVEEVETGKTVGGMLEK